MKYKDILQIENISLVKSELELVVGEIIRVSFLSKSDKENILSYYKSALAYKIKYYKLLAKSYELAEDKEYYFLSKYDNVINENRAEFRRWDKNEKKKKLIIYTKFSIPTY